MNELQSNSSIAQNKMGIAPVWSLLIKMALPIILSTAVQSLYNIVDGIFVSQISEEAMIAITLATPITILLMAIGTGIAVGVNTMLSHALGEGKQAEVNHAAQTAVFLLIIAWLISLVAAFTLTRPFMASQTDNPLILALGVQYLAVYLAFGIGAMGELVFERMLISTGKTLYSMISQITGAALNLILDPILIFGLFGMPEMGMYGAAIATVIGQMAALFIAFYLNIKKNKEISLRFTLRPPLYAVKRILFLGIPQAIMIALNAFLLFGLNGILRIFSETAIAAFGVCCRVTTLFYNLINAMSSTLTPVVAFNQGAKQKKRINLSLRYGYMYGIIMTDIGTVICMLLPEQILSLFHATPQMKEIGVYALRIMATGYMILAIRNVSTAFVQALGHSIQSISVDLCRNYLLLMPLAWLFSKKGILNIVFWAYPVADFTAAVIAILIVWYFYKKDVAIISSE